MSAKQPYAVVAAIKEKTTNKLIAADIVKGTAEKGVESSVILSLDMTNNTNGNYILEIFVWDGTETLKPLMDVTKPFN